MLSPSAGIDPQMLFDTRPLADQILATLQNHTRFHELSAKFAVQLDGGEALAMLEHHHDLWLSAFEQGGETLLAFGTAGCPGLDAPLAAVRLEQGHALVVAVLERFLDLATPAQTRMRHLPVDNFLVGLDLPLLPVDGFKRPASGAWLHLGSYPQRQHGRVYVTAVTPLGRLDASMLKGAAQLADEYGDGTFALYPLARPAAAQRQMPGCRRDHRAPGTTGLPLLGRPAAGAVDRLHRLQRLRQRPGRYQGRRDATGRAAPRPRGTSVRLRAFLRRRAHRAGDLAGGQPRPLRRLFSRSSPARFRPAARAHSFY